MTEQPARAGGTAMETHNKPSVSAVLHDLRGTVRLVRAQRHLSQRQAAEQIGMGYAELSRFENDKLDPQLSTLQKIADWIDEPAGPEPLWHEVTQTLLYDPNNDVVQGNCLQAAVASVLKLPLDAVPHFGQYLWWPQAMALWLRGRDLAPQGERTSTIPEQLCIVGGKSPRGVMHVVVGYEGGVVWDPHPSRAGLVTVTDVTWFEPSEVGRNCWFCAEPWAELMVEVSTDAVG